MRRRGHEVSNHYPAFTASMKHVCRFGAARPWIRDYLRTVNEAGGRFAVLCAGS